MKRGGPLKRGKPLKRSPIKSKGAYGVGDRGKATKLHAQIIRSVGRCEACGATSNLQTAHIYSRRYANTRTDLENAVCLDARCHRWFTDRPLDFAAWCEERFGKENLEALRKRAQAGTKVDWTAELERLREIAKAKGLL